ncbi:flagellar basal body rod protein FlgB [Methylobacterium sp. J-067]|uniref:flagellar basal body rod protein FlgB n=1 Tax=Methylobacterium sp. J-067 TaxID=2836648 RepID=UPI001FBB226C|nr:flagellar basal body rod protein FlgB [Methylobacterium sp. J-067]MCJ2023341.1 flagellar basal body rod protein FlgB [Methylobacterium sp. J-067]
MAISDLPMLAMLRTRMQWNQARQTVIAQNVANADTPGFKPQDLAELRFDKGTGQAQRSSPGLTLTAAGHQAPIGQSDAAGDPRKVKDFEVRPSGNGVNLEDEMMKAGDIQTDYQLAASLYQHSLTTLKIAIGKS